MPSYDENCDFCKIVQGRQEARIVCEGESYLSFFPLRPVIAGHTLVVPKVHVKSIWEATPNIVAATTEGVLRTGAALRSVLHPDGMNIINSAGKAASQTVMHLHVHLVPRWDGDPIGDVWPPSRESADRELGDLAERLRGACR